MFTDFEYDTSILISQTEGFKLSLHNNPLAHLRFSNPNNIPLTTLVLKEPVADMELIGSFSEVIYHGMQATEVEIPWSAAEFVEIFLSPNLQSINIKNGHPTALYVDENSPQFQYVCMDEEDELVDLNTNIFDNVEANTYCTFVPGGDYFDMAGHSRLDLDGNGCDASDIAYPNLRLQINDGSNTYHQVSNGAGYYQVPVSAGTYTVTPQLENPAYFSISPAQISANFPTTATPSVQDFCITANGAHADIEVVLIPLDVPRPGFESHYKLIYKNKGSMASSGTVTFAYENNVGFISADPTPDAQAVQLLSWNYSGLQPFEQREILITVRINSPMDEPAVNGGDVLYFMANGVISDVADETPLDNTSVLNQTAVNSFDPNDKTCLEGATVAPGQAGKYMHYLIRFENTGTANAENIVVRDDIDPEKFDISSLVPMDGGHNFVTRIHGNKAEFIFENIQLPFDDANNDGYVMFKIKTKPTLAEGDSFSNSASIYFDYNHPIVTDPAVTMISVLKNKDFEFSDVFIIYPNPANSVLNLESREGQKVSSVEIYNALGQLMQVVTDAETIAKIEVSQLAAGNYFIRLATNNGHTNAQFIKQ